MVETRSLPFGSNRDCIVMQRINLINSNKPCLFSRQQGTAPPIGCFEWPFVRKGALLPSIALPNRTGELADEFRFVVLYGRGVCRLFYKSLVAVA